MTTPEDDLVAAEYALGTLDAPERTAAAERRVADPAFDDAVAAWENRLAGLAQAAPEAEPGASVRGAVAARIDALAAAGARVIPIGRHTESLRQQVQRWRTATVLAGSLAAALALWIALDGAVLRSPSPGPQLVAFLQRSADEPAFVMAVSDRTDRLSVRPMAAEAPPGKAFELWLIDPSLAGPRSLGVIAGPATSRPVPAGISHEMLARATYAVTVEQPGGSPTGSPSGAPIYLGHLVAAPL